MNPTRQLALKAERFKARKKALKTKTFRMVRERCKSCGEWLLRVQKSANKNRWVVLDLRPLSSVPSHTGRATIYQKHQCRK